MTKFGMNIYNSFVVFLSWWRLAIWAKKGISHNFESLNTIQTTHVFHSNKNIILQMDLTNITLENWN